MKRQTTLAVMTAMMLFMALFSFPAINAQTNPPLNVKEKLPDGNYLARVDASEQRATGATHARDRLTHNDALDRLRRAEPLCEKAISQLNAGFSLAMNDAQITSTQATLKRRRADRFSAIYSGEHALRPQAEQLQTQGRVGKLFDYSNLPLIEPQLIAQRE